MTAGQVGPLCNLPQWTIWMLQNWSHKARGILQFYENHFFVLKILHSSQEAEVSEPWYRRLCDSSIDTNGLSCQSNGTVHDHENAWYKGKYSTSHKADTLTLVVSAVSELVDRQTGLNPNVDQSMCVCRWHIRCSIQMVGAARRWRIVMRALRQCQGLDQMELSSSRWLDRILWIIDSTYDHLFCAAHWIPPGQLLGQAWFRPPTISATSSRILIDTILTVYTCTSSSLMIS